MNLTPFLKPGWLLLCLCCIQINISVAQDRKTPPNSGTTPAKTTPEQPRTGATPAKVTPVPTKQDPKQDKPATTQTKQDPKQDKPASTQAKQDPKQDKPASTQDKQDPKQDKPAVTPTKQPDLTPKSTPSADVETADLDAFKPKPIDTLVAPTIIGFGSCNKLNQPQNMWDAVTANNPGLWIWLGDIIYADTTDMKALAAMYKKLKMTPGYKKLREKAQIVGVYDDHDYGANDACKTFPKKKQSKKCLMDFLDVPMRAHVRVRDGAYTSYTFGKAPQTIKVIVLDSRYFRDSLTTDPTKQKRYIPNMEGSMLGEVQWKWLESELKNSKANLNILCTSVQVVADEHGHEKWGNFPNERKHLLNLIVQSKAKNLLILSGDRHMSEVSKIDLTGLPYPLYDFTSSGMTHVRSGTGEVNHHRVGDMIVKRNFGVLKITWNGDKPIVSMQTRGLQNELFQEVVVKY